MRRHVLMISLSSLGMLLAVGARAQQTTGRPQAYRIGDLRVRVVRGDLMKTPAKALLLNINSGGPVFWNGKVDRVVMATAGTGYHQQLNHQLGQFGDLKTVVARGTKQPGRNEFEHVVFVGDNLESPLRNVVCSGLECANKAGLSSISMPAMRMGVMQGVVERTTRETAAGMVQGIKSFAANHAGGTAVRDVTIVVHNNQDTIDALNASLAGATGR